MDLSNISIEQLQEAIKLKEMQKTTKTSFLHKIDSKTSKDIENSKSMSTIPHRAKESLINAAMSEILCLGR